MNKESAHQSALLSIGDLRLTPDISGVLHEPNEKILIVSDLHLEKASSLARRGSLLPPYDTLDTLRRLSLAIDRLRPQTIISLGDTWHDTHGPSRMSDYNATLFATLRKNMDWIFITGNHDPDPPRFSSARVMNEIEIGGVYFRHEPKAKITEPEIAGHLHPAAKIRAKGRSVRRKCFISDSMRCVLPAFGSLTGGLNVLDKAFDPLFPEQKFLTHIVSSDQLFTVGPHSLISD
jgi:DNA ligase-associated metallophosphoesterase